jgi:hypothetical protein
MKTCTAKQRRLNMSFIDGKSGKVFQAGAFLAHEECTRKTKTVTQAMATTEENGTKYVKMGTIFPANDATAVGIVYEDVDVSTGSMPASVVTKGEVYEDYLPQAVDTYNSATVPTGGNPKELGLYERSGSSPNYVYTLTTDTTAADGKTYYSYTGKKIASAAKTALEGLGFKFVAKPTITRPEWTNA